ncbi:membrane protein, partial [Rhodococcus sp. IITR03]
MRSRLLPLFLAVAGLLLVGTGSVFAWLDRPETTVATVAEEPSPSADGVDEARSNLQRAGLPLSCSTAGVGQLTEAAPARRRVAHQLSDASGS